MEKYRIKAFKNLDGSWSSQYISPASLVDGVIRDENIVRLQGIFKTEDNANQFALNYLKNELKISKDNIIVKENRN